MIKYFSSLGKPWDDCFLIRIIIDRPLVKSMYFKIFLFLNQTYVAGAQENCLNETQNTLNQSCHRLKKYLNMEGLGGGTLTTKMGGGFRTGSN